MGMRVWYLLVLFVFVALQVFIPQIDQNGSPCELGDWTWDGCVSMSTVKSLRRRALREIFSKLK
jgi:hypothetical protein